MPPPDLEQRLAILAHRVGETAPLWRPAPFYHPSLPWEPDYPELAAALRGLSDDAVEALAADDGALRAWLATWLPGLTDVEPALRFPAFDEALPAPADRHDPSRDVPGRKWAQIERFAAAVLAEGLPETERIVDWCGGKSHLGRLLAMHSGRPVTLYERDAALCAQAQALARRDRVNLLAVEGDVLVAADPLPSASQVVALHACGDLHLHLLDLVSRRGVEGLALSPCCYHRTRHATWHWRSRAGRACGLVLQRDDLRIAVLESVTAAPRERAQARLKQQGLLALLRWVEEAGQSLVSVAGLEWRRGEGAEENLRRLAQQLHLPSPDAAACERLWTAAAARAR
ncbi:MAG TPA: methyltransferase, partial [Thioalkalivibrio sp.]|nr:methyltransferase [Thioalkalivibrio sp.]